ncbi:membrane hypothetical protein [Vibrio chagasii]|nr:membrane hypothetical protein [Vibrio chagasii]CAH6989537.1 membrane hypothetical protein [Vibrio chagasii]CAH7037393.1 membrane hypothetical protein [Vibrio chagasii]CAH7245702.1 membrane hypothetical protein [Vibrio chagasii]
MSRVLNQIGTVFVIGVFFAIIYVIYYVTNNLISTARAFNHDYETVTHVVSFLFAIASCLLLAPYNTIRPGDGYIYGYSLKGKLFGVFVSVLFAVLFTACIALALNIVSFLHGGFINPFIYVDLYKQLFEEGASFALFILLGILGPIFMSFVDRGGDFDPEPGARFENIAGKRYAFALLVTFLFGIPALLGFTFG